MPTFGPIYCETLFWRGGFPAEPVNTVSNLAIILFGLIALALVRRRAPRAADLYILAGLLVLNGVGSFLWHGTRTWWALRLDVLPGLVFLLALVFFWARRVSPLWQAGLVLGGFYAFTQYLRGTSFGGYGRWASMTPAVLIVGGWLIVRTVSRSRQAALFGALAISSAMVAVAFRTVDRQMCEVVPFGTHFLWHVFLSGGAFLGILGMLELVRVGTAGAAGLRPARAPAE